MTDKQSNNLTKESVGTCCRTCLTTPNTLYQVFEVSFENLSLSDLLLNCVSIKIQKSVAPQHMCEACVIRLCEISKFKKLCFCSNLLLEEALSLGLDESLVIEDDLDFHPEFVIVQGDDFPCPECPTTFNLSYNLKRSLLHTGISTQLCSACGKSYTIRYDGELTDADNDSETIPEAISKASFEQLCRTCLEKPDITYLIFDISYEGVSMKTLLDLCVSLKVEENDELPKHICETCTTKLCEAFAFRSLCLESESVLLSSYDIKLVKDEIDINDSSSIAVSNSDSESDSDDSSLRDMPSRSYSKSKVICPVCNKSVAHQSYWRHKQLHKSNKILYRCSECPATFNLQCNLKRHVMIHTGERPHLCDYCGKSFRQANTLMEHKRRHTGEKPYRCRRCGKRWSQYSNYKNHVDKPYCSGIVKRGSFKFKCTECCGMFATRHKLDNHKCDETPLYCTVCGRDFITRNALKIHIRTHNGPKIYRCTVCKEDFATRIMFTRHMTRHRSTEHICAECGKGFFNYSGLWSHSKIHNGDQPYVCTVCERAFSQAGSLKSHMLIHTGEKPFICKICKKTFTQPNHLKYHMRTHSGEKPYTCKYCGKSFSLNGTLTVHTRIHTGETPFVCDVCNKGFYDSSSMRKHRYTHYTGNSKVDR